MPVVFKETYSSELSQQDIWNSLMTYSEFNKSLFEGSNYSKKFSVYNEGLKYNIYSEMRGLITLPFLRRLNRINTDMHAELEFVKSENNSTVLSFKIIKTFTRILSEGLNIFYLLICFGFGPVVIGLGVFLPGLILILSGLFLLYFIFKQKKMMRIYKQEYIDLIDKIRLNQ
jgi:hypothetical protein